MASILRLDFRDVYDSSMSYQPVRAWLVCDTFSELPASTVLDSRYEMIIGSKCHVVATGKNYEMKSDGTWVEIIPDSVNYTYTKAEIDTMLDTIESTIYVHDSIQVNLNDIIWTQSGGGLYYSQTITLPDINLLYSVCLSGFASLRATDIIQPACRRSAGWSGFVLYANTNSFNSGAWVTVSGIGTRV